MATLNNSALDDGIIHRHNFLYDSRKPLSKGCGMMAWRIVYRYNKKFSLFLWHAIGVDAAPREWYYNNVSQRKPDKNSNLNCSAAMHLMSYSWGEWE